MITIKKPEDIEKLREGGRRLAQVLAALKEAAVVGAKTADLDALARNMVLEMGDKPAFDIRTPPTTRSCDKEEG